MKDKEKIIKKQLELLEDTAAYYNSNNRAEVGNGCVYHDKETGNKCAIGRLLSKRLCDEFVRKNFGQLNESIIKLLPKKLSKLGRVFLIRLQIFHDTSLNWSETGLSIHGKNRFDLFRENIKDGQFTMG